MRTVALLLCLVPLNLYSQFEHKLFNRNLLIESKVYYGFLYAHHLELELYNAHFPAFELNIQQQTYGKHKWERDFGYPIIGASFYYCGLGYSPSLGQSIALMPFINFPLYRHHNFMLGFRFALGVGVLTEHFDNTENYHNLAIGSHLNAAVNLMFEARYKLNTWVTLTGGINLQHFSNGALKMPNNGINMPMLSLGVAVKPLKENNSITEKYIPPTEPFSAILKRKIEFDLGISLGYKNMSQVYGESYIVTHIYENTLYRVSPKSKWGLGFDVSYDPSQLKTLERDSIFVDNNLEILRPGINVAYELVLSKLGFLVNFGYYLGGAETSNGPLYEKLTLQYNFTPNFFASVMLKVHFGRADYIGWGVGYTFDVWFSKKTKGTKGEL